ncbi:hypothetical protein Agub_g15021, partial [Astrephomene gubernaculifera]
STAAAATSTAAAATSTAAAATSTAAAATSTAAADVITAAAATSTAAAATSTAAADVITAAASRASELRAYVASREADVRSTADRELQRAQERRDRVKSTIERLEKELTEAYDTAVRQGMPAGLVSEPKGWLEALYGRLEAARQLEAKQREEQQAAADAGATLALMGREVTGLLAEEEAAVNKQRVGLEAVTGSMLVAAAVGRVRAADRGLRMQGPHGQGLGDASGAAAGLQAWREVLVGGVHVHVPPEGVTQVSQDPRVACRAAWALSYPPSLGLLRRAVAVCEAPGPVEGAARGVLHGCDQMTVLLCERHLRQPLRWLESRLQEQRKTAENHGTSSLKDLGLPVLLPALEAVRGRTELLRAWREMHRAD